MAFALRAIRQADLVAYRRAIAPSQAFHRLNGPYFGLPTDEDQDKKVADIQAVLASGSKDVPVLLIVDGANDDILGEVSYYWKDERTLWLEVGIIIFNETNWGRGIGSVALPLWMDHLFKQKPELVRLGLTTWSGNPGMIALAEKIGLKKEARFRNARAFEGVYYDSVSYGILKEEWSTVRA